MPLKVPSEKVEKNSTDQENNIVGFWNKSLNAYDDNRNGKLDDEERKKGGPSTQIYRFNPDGTCLIGNLKLKGYYEIKEEKGKKKLYTYFDEGGKKTPEARFFLISITKDELILLDAVGEYAFWIFKSA